MLKHGFRFACENRGRREKEVVYGRDGHVPANITMAPAEGCLTRVMAVETSRWSGVSSTWISPSETSSD